MQTTDAMAGEYLGVREGIIRVHPACGAEQTIRELVYQYPEPLTVRVAYCATHDSAEQPMRAVPA